MSVQVAAQQLFEKRRDVSKAANSFFASVSSKARDGIRDLAVQKASQSSSSSSPAAATPSPAASASLVRLADELATPFDPTSHAHCGLAAVVWAAGRRASEIGRGNNDGNSSTTSAGRDAELLPPFKPGPSPAWKALGFVAPDGVGDMSKTGILAMKALAYAVERHEQAVRGVAGRFLRAVDMKIKREWLRVEDGR